MSVISITLTPSTTETIPGIPDNVSISTNVPSTIFYTLDGSAPDVYSAVYIAPIIFPQSLPSVVLNILALDGAGDVGTVSQTYTGDLSNTQTTVGDRKAQTTVSNLGNSVNNGTLFPFGDNSASLDFTYEKSANPDNTILDESNSNLIPNSYDENGNPSGFSNQPLDPFGQVYSTANDKGEEFPGSGNGAAVKIIQKQTPNQFNQETSSKANKLFNPRALVIYQDTSSDDPSNPVIINRPHFSLEPPETTNDTSKLSPTAPDSNTITGSFIRRSFNPYNHTMTYYYWDGKVNRWIISTSPYTPTTPNLNSFSEMVFGRNSTKVYKWLTFHSRKFP